MELESALLIGIYGSPFFVALKRAALGNMRPGFLAIKNTKCCEQEDQSALQRVISYCPGYYVPRGELSYLRAQP